MLYRKWTDYLNDIYKKYPYIPKRVIRYIVSYGFRKIYDIGLSKNIKFEIKTPEEEHIATVGNSSTNNIYNSKNKSIDIYKKWFIPKWIKFNNNKNNSIYYIPLKYNQFIPLRHNKINVLNNVIVTDNIDVAMIKGDYVISIESNRKYDNIEKVDFISFAEYSVCDKDSNYRIENKNKKQEEDV